MSKQQTIGQMLLAAKMIDEVQMQIALSEQARTGKRLGSTLVELKFVDENVLAAFLSKQVDVPCISLLHIEIPRKLMRRVPGRLARECKSVPVRIEGNTIEMAMVDPTDAATIDLLEMATGLKVHPLIAPESSVEKVLERLYPIEKIDAEDTLAGDAVKVASASDPNFSDLIEDLESGNLQTRLERLEERIEQVWTLLEKVLRILEDRQAASDRMMTREWVAEDK